MKRIAGMLLTGAAALAGYGQATDDGMISIPSGDAVMVVDTEHGAKIVSLTVGGREVLAQHHKPQGIPFENMNDYGSTFWPSPQSEWNWPPIATYDSKPYTRASHDGATVLISGTDEKYPYVIAKAIRPLGDGKYSIAYSITNAAAEPVSVAPWEITRVPSGGKIYFEADCLRPDGEVEYTVDDGILTIPFVDGGRKNRKVFADGSGWLTYEHDGLRLTKRFADISHEQGAPGEDEIEIYYNFGTTYTEIENQGRYTTLLPGEQLVWEVIWEVELK